MLKPTSPFHKKFDVPAQICYNYSQLNTTAKNGSSKSPRNFQRAEADGLHTRCRPPKVQFGSFEL